MMTTFDPEKDPVAPVYGPPLGGDPGSRKWGIGAKVWFVLMILGQ